VRGWSRSRSGAGARARRWIRCRRWYCRAVPRSGGVIDEAGDCATKRRGSDISGSVRARRIHDHDEVMPRGNGERVGRCADGGPEATDTSVAKVVRVDHGRIVDLVVGDAFDVPRTAKGRVDCYGVATRRAARVGEGVGFEVVRSRETTAGTCLAGAGARAAVTADPILLLRITRH